MPDVSIRRFPAIAIAFCIHASLFGLSRLARCCKKQRFHGLSVSARFCKKRWFHGFTSGQVFARGNNETGAKMRPHVMLASHRKQVSGSCNKGTKSGSRHDDLLMAALPSKKNGMLFADAQPNPVRGAVVSLGT